MVLNSSRFENIGEFYVQARSFVGPIFISEPTGWMLSPQLCGSLHHVSHPDKVVNSNSKRKHPTNAVHATMPSLSQHPNGFHPPEDFFNSFPFPLADQIPGMSYGAVINGTRSAFVVLSHMRRDAHTPGPCDEVENA